MKVLIAFIIPLMLSFVTPTDYNTLSLEEKKVVLIDEIKADFAGGLISIDEAAAKITVVQSSIAIEFSTTSAAFSGCCGDWTPDSGGSGYVRTCCWQTSQGGRCVTQTATCPYCLDVPADPCLGS